MMELTKESIRTHVKKYEERSYLDMKTLLAELAIDKDDTELMKLSVLVGLIQSEVNEMNKDDEDSSF